MMAGELVMLTGCLAGIVAVLLAVAKDREPFGHVPTCTGIATRQLDTKRCDKCRWLAERGMAWRS